MAVFYRGVPGSRQGSAHLTFLTSLGCHRWTVNVKLNGTWCVPCARAMLPVCTHHHRRLPRPGYRGAGCRPWPRGQLTFNPSYCSWQLSPERRCRGSQNSAVSMAGQRLRRWPDIKPALCWNVSTPNASWSGERRNNVFWPAQLPERPVFHTPQCAVIDALCARRKLRRRACAQSGCARTC